MIDPESRLRPIATARRAARDHIDHLEAADGGSEWLTVQALRALSTAVGELYEAVSDLSGARGVEPWRPRAPSAGE